MTHGEVARRREQVARTWPAVAVSSVLFAAACGPTLEDSDRASDIEEGTPSQEEGEEQAGQDDGDATDGDDSVDADGGGGDDPGVGGSRWPRLPEGPDIPEYVEIDAYTVLAAADAARCRDLLTDGVDVDIRGTTVRVVPFDAPPPGSFETGDRTYHLYQAAAHLCAGDEADAEAAFASATAAPPWGATDEDTRTVVCRVWEAVTALIGQETGACTLTVGDGDDTGTETGGDAGTGATGTEDVGSAGDEVSDADDPEDTDDAGDSDDGTRDPGGPDDAEAETSDTSS